MEFVNATGFLPPNLKGNTNCAGRGRSIPPSSQPRLTDDDDNDDEASSSSEDFSLGHRLEASSPGYLMHMPPTAQHLRHIGGGPSVGCHLNGGYHHFSAMQWPSPPAALLSSDKGYSSSRDDGSDLDSICNLASAPPGVGTTNKFFYPPRLARRDHPYNPAVCAERQYDPLGVIYGPIRR